jgi:hypothetical protein
MKLFKAVTAAVLSVGILIGANSCTVGIFRKGTTTTNNGKHKGWYKNPNNPHNPNTTNPGHTKSSPGQSKGKSKGPK